MVENAKEMQVSLKGGLLATYVQHLINHVYYRRVDTSPFEFFESVGKYDTLLPRAVAKDFLSDGHGATTVHEVGPGNFNFARTFLEGVNGSVSAYVAHDLSDIAFRLAQPHLGMAGDKVGFRQTALENFAFAVHDDPLYLNLVHMVNDTLTGFYFKNGKKVYALTVEPSVVISAEGLEGKFSQPSEQEVNDAKRVLSLIKKGKIGELDAESPTFFKKLRYGQFGYQPASPDKTWSDRGKESSFASYRKDVLNFFGAQLETARQAYEDFKRSAPTAIMVGREEIHALHLPITTLNLLWDLRSRKRAHINLFEYGYTDAVSGIWQAPFQVQGGKIGASGNFELMAFAARRLGFDTKLETDGDYIKRQLGLDTICVSYLAHAAQLDPNAPETWELLYACLSESVTKLSPTVTCTPKNIGVLRASTSACETFLKVIKEQHPSPFLSPGGYELKEKNYHLTIHKG